jgi:hypothetical protein
MNDEVAVVRINVASKSTDPACVVGDCAGMPTTVIGMTTAATPARDRALCPRAIATGVAITQHQPRLEDILTRLSNSARYSRRCAPDTKRG